jgi:hypothetical protein
MKTLAQPEPRSSPSPESEVAEEVSLGLTLPLGDTQDPPLLAAFHEPRQNYERPPPTDLVITLQHFLI